MRIGVCGTGKMGTAMAERLLEQGFEVDVWNRTKTRAQPVLDQGAEFADTPAALVQSCDIVLIIVLDDTAVAEVYQGANGILSANLQDKVIVEMSTIKPQTIRKGAKLVVEKGAKYVECPVGGTVTPARNG